MLRLNTGPLHDLCHKRSTNNCLYCVQHEHLERGINVFRKYIFSDVLSALNDSSSLADRKYCVVRKRFIHIFTQNRTNSHCKPYRSIHPTNHPSIDGWMDWLYIVHEAATNLYIKRNETNGSNEWERTEQIEENTKNF